MECSIFFMQQNISNSLGTWADGQKCHRGSDRQEGERCLAHNWQLTVTACGIMVSSRFFKHEKTFSWIKWFWFLCTQTLGLWPWAEASWKKSFAKSSHGSLTLARHPLLALWGSKNWPSSIKVKKKESVQYKIGFKDCKWSNWNAQGPGTSLPHPIWNWENSPFPLIALWGNNFRFTDLCFREGTD